MGAGHAAEATAVTVSPISASVELSTQDHRRPQRPEVFRRNVTHLHMLVPNPWQILVTA
jgi:hypothetical protein